MAYLGVAMIAAIFVAWFVGAARSIGLRATALILGGLVGLFAWFGVAMWLIYQ